MLVGFVGETHLGRTLKAATEIRGISTCKGVGVGATATLVFVTPDVEDHNKLGAVNDALSQVATSGWVGPVVLASQVPPGFTRKWVKQFAGPLYYQVDTIIMNCALMRATFPERIVIGLGNPSFSDGPVAAYQQWLTAFECPIYTMSYESAEMVKLAVNYYLAKQVETTNTLAAVAAQVGAEWEDMIPALRADARIGQKSYIRPGTIEGSHLVRDVKTIDQMTTLATAKVARRVDADARMSIGRPLDLSMRPSY